MLLLVRLSAAITLSLDHTTAPRRRGCGSRRTPATDINTHRRQEVVWIAGLDSFR